MMTSSKWSALTSAYINADAAHWRADFEIFLM